MKKLLTVLAILLFAVNAHAQFTTPISIDDQNQTLPSGLWRVRVSVQGGNDTFSIERNTSTNGSFGATVSAFLASGSTVTFPSLAGSGTNCVHASSAGVLSTTVGDCSAGSGVQSLTAGSGITLTGTASDPIVGLTNTSFTLNGSSVALGGTRTLSLASSDFANQGTTTTLLHGNASGNPAFGAVVSADLNITTTTCSNQFVTAISASGTATCTTDTLASAQHANQGTTTTLLHGNASGNPSFAAVSLTADVTGVLPVANGGTNASSASITAFNNITGYSASGATGTTSTNLVFSTSPTLVSPALGTPTALVGTNITGTAAGLTAGNVTTNANLTGVITSVGNATSIASQTGTGTKFVVDTSPTLVTPTLGVATGTRLGLGTAADATNIITAVGDTTIDLSPVTGTGRIQALHAHNTGGSLWAGIESSTGGSIFSGTNAYAAIIGTSGATDVQIIRSSAIAATFGGGTLTINGTTQTTRIGIGVAPDATIPVLINGSGASASSIKIVNTSTAASATAFYSNNGTEEAIAAIESSTGGTAFVGSAAYAAVFGAASNRVTQFASNNNIRWTIDTSGNLLAGGTGGSQVFTSAGALSVALVGPHAIGGATSANRQLDITGSFTGSTNSNGLVVSSTLNVPINGSGSFITVNGTLTEPGSGTNVLLAGVNIALSNPTAGAAATNFAPLNIETVVSPAGTTNASAIRAIAPTAASNNYVANFLESDGSTVVSRMYGSGRVDMPNLGTGAAVQTKAVCLDSNGQLIANSVNCLTVTSAGVDTTVVSSTQVFTLDSYATSQTDVSSTGFINITGLTTPSLPTGGIYTFEVELVLTASSGSGIKFDLNGGSATATAVTWVGEIYSATPSLRAVTKNTALSGVVDGTAATAVYARITGYINIASPGGTVIPRVALSTGTTTSSVLIGSSMHFHRIG